jgi:hypothetical protein
MFFAMVADPLIEDEMKKRNDGLARSFALVPISKKSFSEKSFSKKPFVAIAEIERQKNTSCRRSQANGARQKFARRRNHPPSSLQMQLQRLYRYLSIAKK